MENLAITHLMDLNLIEWMTASSLAFQFFQILYDYMINQ